MSNFQTHREVIGQKLKEIREEKGKSIYSLKMRYETVKAIEEGSSSYTIDSFIEYIIAIDCYIFFGNKEGNHLDFEHMKEQIPKNNPNNK